MQSPSMNRALARDQTNRVSVTDYDPNHISRAELQVAGDALMAEALTILKARVDELKGKP